MDWSKAKNILILAFIVTNMFLFYHLSRDLFVGGDLNLISDQYISNVNQHLKERGIIVEAEIPREIVSLPVLTVKYKQFEILEVAKLFLGSGYNRVYTTKGIVYEKAYEQVTVESDKRIKYYNHNNSGKTTTLNEKDAEHMSKEFLELKGFDDGSVVLKHIHYGVFQEFSNEALYKLVYNQVYNNRFLGESHIHVYINDYGIVGFDGMLLEVENANRLKTVLIPATQALLSKMKDIIDDNNGETIVSQIEMGYYFNPHDFEFAADWHSIESGTAFPAWKITLSNGKVYYVEALKN